MKWILINKSKTAQPTAGNYSKWKPILRKEGMHQCVYCAIHEGSFGGERNFHVEHHKPKKQFPKLVDDIHNLFYCCAICNSFKGSDWPEDPTLQYPYPAGIDYSTFLGVDVNSSVVSNERHGRYIIERLYLNRPQLILMRQFSAALEEIRGELPTLRRLITQDTLSGPTLSKLSLTLVRAVELLSKVPAVVPYNSDDVSRQKHARN